MGLTTEYTFRTSNVEQESEDIKIIYTGVESFVYDNNGDILLEEASLDRILTFEAIAKNNISQVELDAAVQTWLLNGNQISQQVINFTENDNTMFNSMYLDNEGNLHYTIRNKYDINKANNTLDLILTTPNFEYRFKKEIYFSKVGEPGTNGTSYSCEIKPEYKFQVFSNGNIITKSEATKWLVVYKNGAPLITDEEQMEYDITAVNLLMISDDYKIENESIKHTRSCDDWNGKISLGSNLDCIKYLIEYKITILTKYVISYYYPITYTTGAKSINNWTLPTSIRYTGNGGSPYYYNNFYYIDNKQEKIGEKTVEIVNDEIRIEYNKSKESLKPKSPKTYFDYNLVSGGHEGYYVNENSLILKKEDTYYIFPIISYLNSYGNDTVNNWDGISIKLDNQSHTILANQVVAGVKHSDNTFSGVVMGSYYDNDTKKETGIYGFSKGQTTFSITQDGNASFGMGENCLIISPNNNKVSLRIGTDFYVSSEGDCKITHIEAESGYIGNLKIDSGTLSNENTGFEIDSSQSRIWFIGKGANRGGIRGTTGGGIVISSSSLVLGAGGDRIYITEGGPTLKQYIQSLIPSPDPVIQQGE